MGNLFTDKYAEGYPHHRFYAGCDNVDAIEATGAELAQELFGAQHAYLQPHSGADANLVAFSAILTRAGAGPDAGRDGPGRPLQGDPRAVGDRPRGVSQPAAPRRSTITPAGT